MKNSFFSVLTSFGFTIGLLLLLINDFFLKATFHNAFTGKLSDFAGLFIFALFWGGLFPKLKTHIIITIGLLFVFWKSPLSSFFIDSFNSIAPYSIGRIVDYSDVWALLVLPVAHNYLAFEFRVPRFKLYRILPLCLAIFSFLATSRVDDESEMFIREFSEVYGFDVSINTFTDNLDRITDISTPNLPRDVDSYGISISIAAPVCTASEIDFAILVTSVDEQNTTLELVGATYYCREGLLNDADLLQLFQERVVDNL